MSGNRFSHYGTCLYIDVEVSRYYTLGRVREPHLHTALIIILGVIIHSVTAPCSVIPTARQWNLEALDHR